MKPFRSCWQRPSISSRGRISLISGATSRQKKFLVDGIEPDELKQRLAALLAETE